MIIKKISHILRKIYLWIILISIFTSCEYEMPYNSPHTEEEEQNLLLKTSCSFELPQWTTVDNYWSMMRDSISHSGKYSIYMGNSEFSPGFMSEMGKIAKNQPVKADVSIWTNYLETPDSNSFLVVSVKSGQQSKLWVAAKLYNPEIEKHKWFKTDMNVGFPLDLSPNDTLLIYVWNPKRKKFLIDDMNIKFY